MKFTITGEANEIDDLKDFLHDALKLRWVTEKGNIMRRFSFSQSLGNAEIVTGEIEFFRLNRIRPEATKIPSLGTKKNEVQSRPLGEE